MTEDPWPTADETEPTPIYDGVLTKEHDVPAQPPTDESTANPQEPGAIIGYQSQTPEKIDAVNTNKGFENDLGRWLKQLQADVEDIDGRWVSIARTHFQQGFMALNRAVFQPESEL